MARWVAQGNGALALTKPSPQMAANAEEVAETQGGGLGAPRAFEQDEGAFGVALDGQSLQKAPRARTLMDLHDLCILQILKNLTPLPDLFHVALTNKVPPSTHHAVS